jgi:hypothetical protein
MPLWVGWSLLLYLFVGIFCAECHIKYVALKLIPSSVIVLFWPLWIAAHTLPGVLHWLSEESRLHRRQWRSLQREQRDRQRQLELDFKAKVRR